MPRIILIGLLLVAVCWPLKSESEQKAGIELNGHSFRLPAGFEIELVAGPPLVDRPVTADFDEAGHLYVADSSGSNARPAEQLKNPTHRIVRLADSNGDGKYDQSIVYADKLPMMQGTMWYDGSLYVAAPPHILKLTDTNGDGQADSREVWFDGKTLTGCANDLHGPYLGPDGYIYWTKGAFAEQEYTLPNGKPFKTRCSHIFRALPDGSKVEPVMTGGMDNPVDVAFTPTGERFFTTTFFQHPGGGLRDGIIHAVYGAIYGKDHGPIYEQPWTHPELMPPMTHLGAAAPCGLHAYENPAFGNEYRHNLFASLFNMAKVTRHVPVRSGATYQTEDSDFLVSENRDFHPTDVIEDADGSLLVIDTGGWYKLCCPTSQLAKEDLLGAIYRVKRSDAKPITDPRGLKLEWGEISTADLAKRLNDDRPAVVKRAQQALAKRQDDAVPALATLVSDTNAKIECRRNAAWTLGQIGTDKALTVVRRLLANDNQDLRLVACHLVSLHRDRQAVDTLRALLDSDDSATRRAAAEALGRIGNLEAVPELLNALNRNPADRAENHSIIFALIEIGDKESLRQGIESSDAAVVRGALIASDQIDYGSLSPSQIAERLADKDEALRQAAWWIFSRHPNWARELQKPLENLIKTTAPQPQRHGEVVQQLSRFCDEKAVQALLVRLLEEPDQSQAVVKLVLSIMSKSQLKSAPEPWYRALTKLLQLNDNDLSPAVVQTVKSLPPPAKPQPELKVALTKLGQDRSVSAQVRFTALAAIPNGPGELDQATFAELLRSIDREQPVTLRSQATELLSKASISENQLVELAKAMANVAPMELDKLLEIFGKTRHEQVGLALLKALTDSPTRNAVRQEMLEPRLKEYPESVKVAANSFYKLVNQDVEQQAARIDQLMQEIQGGDIRRGQAVFNSTKAGCINCHAMGYLGGKVGPDLTRIGGIRSERDLLESIVYPSASFVRSYESVKVVLFDGRVFNGIIKDEQPQQLVLTLNANDEIRIARDDIDEITPSNLSIMPSGLDQQLSKQDLADLIAFLKASR